MTRKDERAEQLMQYIKVMEGLQKSGFRCESEIKETMRELHELMMPREKHYNVVLLVKDTETAKAKAAEYESLLGKSTKVRPSTTFMNRIESGRIDTGGFTVRNDLVKTTVEIMPVADFLLKGHIPYLLLNSDKLINESGIESLERTIRIAENKDRGRKHE